MECGKTTYNCQTWKAYQSIGTNLKFCILTAWRRVNLPLWTCPLHQTNQPFHFRSIPCLATFMNAQNPCFLEAPIARETIESTCSIGSLAFLCETVAEVGNTPDSSRASTSQLSKTNTQLGGLEVAYDRTTGNPSHSHKWVRSPYLPRTH
jgi:hypothetical protein